MPLRRRGFRYALIALSAAPFLIGTANAQSSHPAAETLPERILRRGTAEAIVLFKAPTPVMDARARNAYENPANHVAAALSLPPDQAQTAQRLGREGAAIAKIDLGHLQQLQADKNVELIAPNRSYAPALLETVRLSGLQPATPANIAAVEALGKGWAVAILDTGFDTGHDLLKGKLALQACFSKNDKDDGIESLCPAGEEQPSGDVVDLSPQAASRCPLEIAGCGHGTHIAGIVAGNVVKDPRDGTRLISGMAPGASVVGIQVFSKYTRSDECFPNPAPCARALDSSLLQALDYVQILELQRRITKKGPQIVAVNLSLGSGQKIAPCDTSNPLSRSIKQLRELGILTFIASGNDGFLFGVAEPGCISSAMTVGAVNKLGAIWNKTNRAAGDLIDLMAVGVDIYSSWPNNSFAVRQGTSMATAVASGTFAALRAAFPALSVQTLETALKQADSKVVDNVSAFSFPMLDFGKTSSFLADQGNTTVTAVEPSSDSASSLEQQMAKEFIVDVKPTLTSQQAKAKFLEASPDLNSVLEFGNVNIDAPTKSNILLKFEKPVDRKTLQDMLEQRIDGLGTVYVNRPRSPLSGVQ